MGDPKSFSDIKFVISLAPGENVTFVFTNESGHEYVSAEKDFPEWLELHFKKCPECPLKGSEEKYCPAALAVFPIARSFNSQVSCRNVKFRIEKNSKKIEKEVPLQEALSEIYINACARSRCPILKQLRFLCENGLTELKQADVLVSLEKLYSESPDKLLVIKGHIKSIRKALYYFSRRVSAGSDEDANRNAFIGIDTVLIGVELLIDKKIED